jgi:hypothetical protein
MDDAHHFCWRINFFFKLRIFLHLPGIYFVNVVKIMRNRKADSVDLSPISKIAADIFLKSCVVYKLLVCSQSAA